jgi:uncharacterized membrane protein
MNEQQHNTGGARELAAQDGSTGYVAHGMTPRILTSGTPTVGLGAMQAQAQPASPKTVADLIRRVEFWLNKVGIVLFLFGVIFLFQQAIERNWLDEVQRLVAGGLMGALLLGWGFAIHRKLRHLSQVLMGGGIATLYITAFCSYVLFTSLKVPYELAFGAMATVTALAFALALWGDDVALALIAILGGLCTPFALGFANIDISPIMIYTRLLLVAVGAIYLFRGWRSLLWASALGSTAIFFWGLTALWYSGAGDISTLIDVQITLVIALITFWAVPVAHELLSWGRPTLFRKPPVSRLTDPALRPILNWHLYIMPVLAPFMWLAFSADMWNGHVPQVAWGLITLALAGVCGAAAWYIREQHGPLALLHKWLGIALATFGLVILTGAYRLWDGHGSLVLLTLALQAIVMHVIAHRFQDRAMGLVAHGLFAVSGLWLLGRLLTPGWEVNPAFSNPQALVDLAVIGLVFGASLLMRKVEVRFLYQVSAHLATLLWLWRETVGLSLDLRINYIALAIAIYATVLHFMTRRSGRTEDTQLSQWGQAFAHMLFAVAGSWVIGRILWGLLTVNPDGAAIFNPRGLTDLGVLLLAALSAYLLRNEPDRRPLLLYGLGLHAGFLGWSWQEVGLLDSGNGFVTIVWGAYSLALIGAALYFMRQANDGRAISAEPAADGRATPGRWLDLLNTPRVVTLILGLLTLFGVAGKLFLVDLRYLDAIWRILLFLGFGALFLLISHGFGTMTRRIEPESQS